MYKFKDGDTVRILDNGFDTEEGTEFKDRIGTIEVVTYTTVVPYPYFVRFGEGEVDGPFAESEVEAA